MPAYYSKTAVKYKLNHNFFAIDTPESFYWAGFIMADGNIAKRTKMLDIELGRVDKCLLEKFRDHIEYDGKIINTRHFDKRNGKTYYSCKINICSDEIVKSLSNRFSVFPAKTYTCKFPDRIINHNLVNHFIRGYMDGDGSWYFCSSRPKEPRCKVIGTENIVGTIKNIFTRECFSGDVKLSRLGSVYAIKYSGRKQVIRIRNFVYRDAGDLLLKRKKAKAYNSIIDERGIGKGICVIGSALGKDNIFLKSYSSGRHLGFDASGICNCCSGRTKTHKGYFWRFATPEEVDKYLI